jgi:cytochrome b561
MIMESTTYSRGARWLHWAMAVLIIGNLIGGLVGDLAPELIIPLHKSTGLLILALALVRIGWRLTHRPPAFPAAMAGWERTLASVTHVIFYAMIILIPVSGWVMASAGDYPLDFFGLFPVMKFDVVKESTLWDIAHEGHELLAYAMIGLLLLHIIAALRHHFVLKDGILVRMLG